MLPIRELPRVESLEAEAKRFSSLDPAAVYAFLSVLVTSADIERRMEARRLEESDEEALKVFRRGWCHGSEEFRRQLVEKMEGKLGENHAGALHFEATQARAERILAEELSRLGWTASDLARRRKNDPDKLAIAARLRRETTLTIKSIAAKVHLGSPKSAKTRMHERGNAQSGSTAHQPHLGI